ncbi:hypothetical protein ABEY43_06640 [Priestia megaterium]
MEFTQKELMQLFLSVYAIERENENDLNINDEEFGMVLNKFTGYHEVTEYGKELQKQDTNELLKKLLSKIELG